MFYSAAFGMLRLDITRMKQAYNLHLHEVEGSVDDLVAFFLLLLGVLTEKQPVSLYVHRKVI